MPNQTDDERVSEDRECQASSWLLMVPMGAVLLLVLICADYLVRMYL